MGRFVIITECIFPPVPSRKYDWAAYLEGTEESGKCGFGETEMEAIRGLAELLEE